MDRRALDGLEGDLARFVAAAQAEWPTLALDAKVFAEHVARHSAQGGLPPVRHAADLFLACACAHDVPGAHDAFQRRYAKAIARVIGRKNPAEAFVDEARQRLWEHLFVAASGLPRIAEYGGRAALQTWLGIAASRMALMLLRGEGRARETAEQTGALAAQASPELTLLKRRYTRDFASALEDAFTKLSDKERTLLRLDIENGLSIDDLGRLYDVGRSTAARWLAAARTKLVDETRSELRRRLGLTESEYESLAVLVRSQLDVSVLTLLRSGRHEAK